MNDINQYLKPVSGSHSIKEAVITVFLASKIIKPKNFGELMNNVFKDSFSQFENIENTQVKMEGQNLSIIGNDEAGFKFIGFNSKGHTSLVLRGVNDENRYLISLHILDYASWTSFKEQFIGFLDKLDNFQPGNHVTAYGLTFLDEFDWDQNKPYLGSYIFNVNSDFLPKRILNSQNIIYSYSSQEGVDQDKLDIIISDKLRSKNIIINHTQVIILPDPQRLFELLKDKDFDKNLNTAHSKNKEVLTDVLNEDVCCLIKLNKQL